MKQAGAKPHMMDPNGAEGMGPMRSDRMRQRLFGTLIATSLATAGIAAAPAAMPSDAGALQAQQQAYNRAIAAHDAQRLGTLMTEDVSFTSHILHRQGRADVLATWTGLWARRPDLAMRFDPDRTRISAAMNVASETGRWTETWSEPDGRVTMSGTYFTVWSRDTSSAWHIAAETIAPMHCQGGAYCRR
jgi:ketosteroid isomerase-like protein